MTKDKGIVLIRDSRYVAKKYHQCHHCHRRINPLANYRRIVIKDGDKFVTMAIHEGCAQRIESSISAHQNVYAAFAYTENEQFTMHDVIDKNHTEETTKQHGVATKCMRVLIRMVSNFLRIKKALMRIG